MLRGDSCGSPVVFLGFKCNTILEGQDYYSISNSSFEYLKIRLNVPALWINHVNTVVDKCISVKFDFLKYK